MDYGQLNPLILAYLGDAAYELEVRKFLAEQGITKLKTLHTSAIKLVKATTQAEVMHGLMDSLNDEEAGIVRRGRNAKSGTSPKNTDIIDYRYATAFEALIGYWYLNGKGDKIMEAVRFAVETVKFNYPNSDKDRTE